MHRYDRAIMQDWHPGWLFVPACVWLILISMALSIPIQHYEPGVRHALPDPYVPQCYTVEWRSGNYCEFRPTKKLDQIEKHS